LDGRSREQAHSVLAVAYRCLDAVANKLGYFHLSYLAVERVSWAARNSADPLMEATASYLRGQACLDVGHHKKGLKLLDQARRQIEPGNKTSIRALSVYGTLHLRSAVLAACDHDAGEAWAHIEEAQRIAGHVGKDVTHYWTFFGPSNAAIHAVATAVELGDYARAVDEASKLRMSPSIPHERSSHHYIDLARAYLRLGYRDKALQCLLQAELIAPHHTRHHPATRGTVRVLLELSRGKPTDLVALAGRTGLAS
jgi:tetratricopeptide (TPR) repeat protein